MDPIRISWDVHRFLIPTRGASSADVAEIGRGLRGPVIDEFREMLGHSNGVNFLGVHLVLPGASHFADDLMIVSSLIVSDPVFHRISILRKGDQCAFFEGPYDEQPEHYAASLQELFARLYDDIQSGRLFGSQL